MILVIFNQDVMTPSGPYYADDMAMISTELYLAIRSSGFVTRPLAKCASPTGVTYWAEAMCFKRGVPSTLKPGHRVVDPWFDPRVHGVKEYQSATIAPSTNGRMFPVKPRTGRPCGCRGFRKPEESNANHRSHLVDAAVGSVQQHAEQAV